MIIHRGAIGIVAAGCEQLFDAAACNGDDARGVQLTTRLSGYKFRGLKVLIDGHSGKKKLLGLGFVQTLDLDGVGEPAAGALGVETKRKAAVAAYKSEVEVVEVGPISPSPSPRECRSWSGRIVQAP